MIRTDISSKHRFVTSNHTAAYHIFSCVYQIIYWFPYFKNTLMYDFLKITCDPQQLHLTNLSQYRTWRRKKRLPTPALQHKFLIKYPLNLIWFYQKHYPVYGPYIDIILIRFNQQINKEFFSLYGWKIYILSNNYYDCVNDISSVLLFIFFSICFLNCKRKC